MEYNELRLTGKIVTEPAYRQSGAGKAAEGQDEAGKTVVNEATMFARCRLSYRDSRGKVGLVTVKAFGKTAQAFKDNVKLGQIVEITKGEIRFEEWRDSNDHPQNETLIVCYQLVILQQPVSLNEGAGVIDQSGIQDAIDKVDKANAQTLGEDADDSNPPFDADPQTGEVKETTTA